MGRSKLVFDLQPEGMVRSGLGGATQPSGVVLDRLPSSEGKFAEHRRSGAMASFVLVRPIGPLAHLAETLETEFKLGQPAVLGLPLIEELYFAGLLDPVVAFEEGIGIELDLTELGLEERTPLYFPAFGAIGGAFDFQQESDIHGVLTSFAELEFVFPLDGVVLDALVVFALVLQVDFGEPPLFGAIAEANACSGAAGIIVFAGGAGFKIYFSLAVFDSRRVNESDGPA